MRKLTFTMFCIYFLPLHGIAEKLPSHPQASIPSVSLARANIFDQICADKTGYDISPQWSNELEQQIPKWRVLWQTEGRGLLESTVELVARPFAQKAFQVALSVCNFPSMSVPLLVNTRYALHSFTRDPVSADIVISNIYHEILHNYIDSFLPKNTPLLKKYHTESLTVLNHLHLFALQKAVYLKLGWNSELKTVIAKDNSLPNKDYHRAWEIINRDNQYYKAFVAELINS